MRTGTAANRRALTAMALAAGIGLCLFAGTRPAPARAAQKDKDEKKSPSATVDPACGYLKDHVPTVATAGQLKAGIGGCTLCHIGKDKDGATKFVEMYKSNEFVRLDESTTWEQKDIHAAALKTLTDPDGLGKKIEAVLKKFRPEGYVVEKAPECLTCHSVDLSPHTPLGDKKYADFATAPGGVTCTLCHGLHQTWQNEHYDEPNQAGQPMPWRAKPPEYKFSKGMHDLRNPVVKAQLCASCHVGNAAEGKVVTHEIYAAGHPPLPPFELASYMEGQPRHWGYATELPYFREVKAGDDWKLFHFNPADKEAYLARHYAAGAIVALRAEADLLLAEANRAAGKGESLDFARFDCYSCHHELRQPSERQKRGYDGPPGRTPLRAAAGIPAGVVAKHAEGIDAGGLDKQAAGFDAKWLALKKAATAKPFGDPDKIKADAKAMKDWCDAFLTVQSSEPAALYPPAEAARLRDMVMAAAVDPKTTADPEAAMVLTWAAYTLAKETKHAVAEHKALDAVVPPNVRMEPFSVMAGKRSVPETAKYPERMKHVADFSAPKFVDAFNGVFGKK